MRVTAIAGVMLVLVSMGCAVFAADAPKVNLDANNTPIDQAVADLAKQANVQIVCEPGIKGTVTGSFTSIELEKLLNAITKSNSLTWQKVYLPAPKDGEKPSIEQIRARAEAVAAVTSGTVVVVDPVTGKQKVFVEQDPAAPSVEPEKLGLKPVYLVTKPKAQDTSAQSKQGNQDVSKQYKAIESQRIQLLSQMTPEQRVAAMQQEAVALMSMTPEVRQQIMMDQMRARFNMDPQTRDQYRQAMHDTFDAMRRSGQFPEGGWRGGDRGDRGGRGDRGDRGGRTQ